MLSPWSIRQLEAELCHGAGLLLVAICGQTLAGYVAYRVLPPEAELLRLVVLPGYRRLGIATSLLDKGIQSLVGQGIAVCFLEVRGSNQSARALYGHCGFMAVGMRKSYYHHPEEDAVVMQLDMNELAEGI